MGTVSLGISMVDYSDGEEILKLETEPKKLYKFKYITFSVSEDLEKNGRRTECTSRRNGWKGVVLRDHIKYGVDQVSNM